MAWPSCFWHFMEIVILLAFWGSAPVVQGLRDEARRVFPLEVAGQHSGRCDRNSYRRGAGFKSPDPLLAAGSVHPGDAARWRDIGVGVSGVDQECAYGRPLRNRTRRQ